jgi:hypothetical protein
LLTDLPKRHVNLVNRLLKEAGIGAQVLINEDPSLGGAHAKWVYSFARELIDIHLENEGAKAKIYICTLYSPEFNAAAIPLPRGEYCIAIFLGALTRARAINSWLLSTEPLATIMDYEPEAFYESTSALNPDSYQALDILSLLAPTKLQPRGEEIVSEIAAMSLHWIVLHELGHIRHGHFCASTPMNRLAMVTQSDRGLYHDANLTRHALELDADIFGVHRFIEAILHEKLFGQGISFNKEQQKDVEFDVVRMLTLAVYGAVRGFDHQEASYQQILSSSYPPGTVRIILILLLIGDIWKISNDLSADDNDVVLLSLLVCDRVEKAIGKATGAELGLRHMVMGAQICSSGYRDSVSNRRDELLPELNRARLTKIPLAPSS